MSSSLAALYSGTKVAKRAERKWQRMRWKAHRHGHLSNAIEQDDQQAEEGEAHNLLAIVGADGVDVGS